MRASGAARQETYVPRRRAATTGHSPVVAARARTLAVVGWAVVASTLHRVRRGECALLAVNLSLIAYQGASLSRALVQVLVSTLAIAVMYAFNDLYDAPVDWKNPKKDRALIAAWVKHRRAGIVVIAGLHVVTLALALLALGPGAAGAAAGVMVVNVGYSISLKGVPVADVAWVCLWGALYAAIVGAPPAFIGLVGLMTGICHLYQALDDREPDAANGIHTTAVRSAALSRNVLFVLTLLLFAALRGPLGVPGALTAFTPLAFYFVATSPAAGWLLTKAYFAVVWLYVLGTAGAAG